MPNLILLTTSTSVVQMKPGTYATARDPEFTSIQQCFGGSIRKNIIAFYKLASSVVAKTRQPERREERQEKARSRGNQRTLSHESLSKMTGCRAL